MSNLNGPLFTLVLTEHHVEEAESQSQVQRTCSKHKRFRTLQCEICYRGHSGRCRGASNFVDVVVEPSMEKPSEALRLAALDPVTYKFQGSGPWSIADGPVSQSP